MAALASAEAVGSLADFAVVREAGRVVIDYPVGQFCVPEHSPDTFSCAIIACVGPRFLVALPSEAWSKTTRDRRLPPGSLEKALHIQVAACLEEDRGSPLDSVSVNAWIGWLKAGFENNVEFDPITVPSFPFVTRELGETCLPFAQAMMDAVVDKFQLQDILNSVPLETRMSAMEGKFKTLEAGVGELLAYHRGGQTEPGEGGFVSAAENPVPAQQRAVPNGNGPVRKLHLQPRTQPAAMEGVEPPPGFSHLQACPGLDPTAVAAAPQAGIPEEQIRAMSHVLAGKPTRLEDYPRPSAAPRHPLDEDLEEEDDHLPLQEGANLDPMSQALVKLTSIVDQLATKKRSADPMEEIVDGVSHGDVGTADGSSSTLGKKHAAMRQALTRTLRDHPERLWKIIERNMEEDFHLQTMKPNSGTSSFSARGWAEHRSRIAGFPRTVRSVWGIAGILDQLRAGNADGARARAGLML